LSDEKLPQTIYLGKSITGLLEDYATETETRKSDIIENALSILFKTRDEVGESVDADFNLQANFREQRKLLEQILDLVSLEKRMLAERREALRIQYAKSNAEKQGVKTG